MRWPPRWTGCDKPARLPCLAQGLRRAGVDAVLMRMVRLARRERAQLLVEAPGRPALVAFLTAWSCHLWAARPVRGLRWHLDVDPAEARPFFRPAGLLPLSRSVNITNAPQPTERG